MTLVSCSPPVASCSSPPGAGIACLDPSPWPRTALVAPRRATQAVVTVRGRRFLTVTFTAALAKRWGIQRLEFGAVRVLEAERRVEFWLSDDPTRHGVAYQLGYNGGASRQKNSPSRVLHIRADDLAVLPRGQYWPEVERREGAVVVGLKIDEAF